jgi:quercetin dioxygenase-like cupin family protein
MSHAAVGAILASAVLVIAAGPAQQPELKAVRPDEIKWIDHPALSPGNKRAVVYGDPTRPGLYATRLRSPEGMRILPHTHPEDRIYTVLSGTLYLGIGDTFDDGKLVGYPRGSVIFLPAKLSHYQYAKGGGYEIQINAVGPTDITYVKPADDPRHR